MADLLEFFFENKAFLKHIRERGSLRSLFENMKSITFSFKGEYFRFVLFKSYTTPTCRLLGNTIFIEVFSVIEVFYIKTAHLRYSAEGKLPV